MLQSILRLLNSCPRLTHLSLTGVSSFQRDDFTPFCRQAPPEFTQHQRDVFCVFSGNMVSSFRHYLNSDPQFEELRACYPVSRYPRTRQTSRFNTGGPPTNGDAGDEEMGDDNDDYEGMGGPQQIPPPPPPPIFTVGAPSGSNLNQQQWPPIPMVQPQPGLPFSANYTGWLNNYPPSAEQQQASYASVAGTPSPTGQPQTNGTQTNGAQPNGGASTAPLYNYFTPLDEQDQQSSQQN